MDKVSSLLMCAWLFFGISLIHAADSPIFTPVSDASDGENSDADKTKISHARVQGLIVVIKSKPCVEKYLLLADITKVQQLMILDLTPEDAFILTNYLKLKAKSLVNLKKLVLKNIVLQENIINNLVAILNNAYRLRELKLESNLINADDMVGFKKIKSGLPIQKLEIINNQFDQACSQSIRYLFEKLNNLIFLSFRDSNFKNYYPKYLKEIGAALVNLVYLDLANVRINADYLMVILSKVNSLKHLDVSHNSFSIFNVHEVKQTQHLQDIFSKLENLNLAHMGMDATSMFKLVNLIGKYGHMRVLDLSNNHIGNEGMHLLMLSPPKTLEKLIVANNGIDNVSLAYIKNNIENFPLLKLLDFSENKLSGGIGEITEILNRAKNLKNLKIAQASLVDSDIKILAYNFDVFNNLHTLNIDDNAFTALGLKYLEQISINTINLRIFSINMDSIPRDVFLPFIMRFSEQFSGCRIAHTQVGIESNKLLPLGQNSQQ